MPGKLRRGRKLTNDGGKNLRPRRLVNWSQRKGALCKTKLAVGPMNERAVVISVASVGVQQRMNEAVGTQHKRQREEASRGHTPPAFRCLTGTHPYCWIMLVHASAAGFA